MIEDFGVEKGLRQQSAHPAHGSAVFKTSLSDKASAQGASRRWSAAAGRFSARPEARRRAAIHLALAATMRSSLIQPRIQPFNEAVTPSRFSRFSAAALRGFSPGLFGSTLPPVWGALLPRLALPHVGLSPDRRPRGS
jgi:hypothetical protein